MTREIALIDARNKAKDTGTRLQQCVQAVFEGVDQALKPARSRYHRHRVEPVAIYIICSNTYIHTYKHACMHACMYVCMYLNR